VNTLTRSLLPAAVAATLAACGGGGYDDGGNNNPPPPPPITIADAQFAVEKIDGLGFRGNGITEGRTDATGNLKFGVGQTVEFFLGEGANKLVVGSATVTAAANNGVASIGLKDLKEVATTPTFLDNVISLLVSLDANSDVSDGIKIDAATNTAIATAIAGKTLNFNQASDAFKADPVIAALFTALNRTFLDATTALADFSTLFPQSRSSSIAITSDNTRVVVANRQKSSVSIIRVRAQNGADAKELLAEIKIDKEPRFVAISPDDKRAYVTSAVGGTMAVIDLTATPKPVLVGQPVFVGLEPRGIAITPNGKHAFVALHTTGEVAVVDLEKLETQHFIQTGGNPQAVVITNDGDNDELDERVYVTRMFGETIDPVARPDGFDDAKQGVVDSFTVASAVNAAAQISQIKLLPLAAGFNADRRQFCEITRGLMEGVTEVVPGQGPLVLFNSGANGDLDVNDKLANPTFCPNTNSADISAGGEIGRVAQKVYPNMLFSALVRGRRVYVPNEGASPEPPVRFNVNVQALVGVIDRTKGGGGLEDTNLTLNLNTQVAKETQPAEADARNTLDRLFLNDVVAVDADRAGRNFLFVSRGGNYVVRAGLDATGKLNILDGGTPPKAKRLQTGNMPTGVVMSSDGTRAYANNEINTSITALDLANNTVLERDIESSTPPAPGTQEHRNLVGKLVFFTALGVPDDLDTTGDGQFDIALRDIDPLKNRGKASDNGWSSCASCHDDGHSDNVTWIFEVGPRQTIPLEGMFTHDVPDVAGRLLDQRALNWSAVRGSNTDFNQNAIGIQGGTGFAKETAQGNRSGLVFNHGPVFGVSDSLDALQEWVTTVRAPIVPILPNAQPGRVVFEQHCASCHGGAKWTKSQVTQLFAFGQATNSGLDATFAENPIGAGFFNVVGGVIVGVKPFDAGLATNGPQLLSVTRGGSTLKLLDDVGTFFGAATAEGKLEIRGAAAVGALGSASGLQSTQGFGAFGGLGFNSPSLLGLSMSAPYLHDGSAQTLEDVMAKHKIDVPDGNGGTTKVTIQNAVNAQQLSDLLNFVRTIEDETPPVDSATDVFLEQNPLP
jgi:DNA-binding beta-propeller fold protein YncE